MTYKRILTSLSPLSLLPYIHPNSVYAAIGDIVGTVDAPPGIPSNTNQVSPFISVIVKLFVVVAGLFTLWQFLSGGFDYISSGGDKGKISQATQKITNSIIGLVVIAASFIIIALAGFILFDDAGAFLNPKINTL